MIKLILNNFIRYKDLIIELVLRDIKVKYKKSILGFAWSILNPLLMMMVLSVVFSTIFRNDIKNFKLYLITGHVLFTFFSESTSISMTSIVSNASLIKKVYIPKYIFPLSKVMFSFSNLIFSLVAVFIVAILTKLDFNNTIFLIPIPLMLLFIFSLGISLILSMTSVFFRDILHLYSIILLIWNYLTPVFYPISIIPENIRNIFVYNPINIYIEYFRMLILESKIPNFELNVFAILYACISLTIGIIVFNKLESKSILHI